LHDNQIYVAEPRLAADNKHVTNGPFAAAFKKTMGKTFYLGQKVPSGNVWKAKGGSKLMTIDVLFITLQILYSSP